jgi:fermentation-respiration switch protein FrsA (DUF1100 family)
MNFFYRTSIEAISPIGSIAMLAPTPMLIIAGDKDRLIPAEHAKRLYATAREPKEIWIIPGADLGRDLAATDDAYEMKVEAFFDNI